ncbi:DNA (cytosine-5-)-methyltransferase [Mycoplasma sp. NEAQ87857]|uniref:DNA (cytosine-5-)-methyltransferase n=1 Tax=Mycoplasma sp. NEAQ87857 TaxID=2683967 RepID=UPI0013161744|nr:DNA (cytosine-5-)-methyltransferase [Mycoplasma sp. NEAQ87857]QGZ97790.1 DNA (cytosine-5-)-methyltransferase [Mycoplasma sp. NEAQ87857]
MKFFDFCSGIGGGRLGLELNGLECVGHCEIDPKADDTYKLFFNDFNNYGDLTKVDIQKLPDFDFMIAGFPCQTFSIAGKRKGLQDKRGQIIYSLIQILINKNIKCFLLENVKGLINHNKGETLKTIVNELENAGYNVFYKVLNSIDYGVAQSRERIYLVGFKKELGTENFEFPNGKQNNYDFNQFLDEDNDLELQENNPTFLKYLSNKYNQNKYTIDEITNWENCVIDWRQSDLRKYNKVFPTLRTGRHGLLYIKNKKIKKLNGYEALLLQGFPKEIAIKVKQHKIPNNTVLSQAGNAMTVSVIKEITHHMLKEIKGIN